MAKNAVPVGYVTQNKAAEWLGRDRGVIRRLIADHSLESKKVGRYEYYKLSDFVDAMLGGDQLDLQQERARLAQKQTEKARLQIAQMKGELVDIEEVGEEWDKRVVACRAKLLSVPTKIAGDVMACQTLSETQATLKKEIYEALIELASD